MPKTVKVRFVLREGSYGVWADDERVGWATEIIINTDKRGKKLLDESKDVYLKGESRGAK